MVQAAEKNKKMTSLIRSTYSAALAFDIPIISTDNAARLMAVLYVHGNNEFMTHCEKFNIEREYIQKRFHLQGSEIPDAEFARLLKGYVYQLEKWEKQHPKEPYAEWAVKLYEDRYGIRLFN